MANKLEVGGAKVLSGQNTREGTIFLSASLSQWVVDPNPGIVAVSE